MIKNTLFCLIYFFAFTAIAMGQTDEIAHKSHSGTAETFVENTTKNFGLPWSEVEFYMMKEQSKNALNELEKRPIQPITVEIKPSKALKTDIIRKEKEGKKALRKYRKEQEKRAKEAQQKKEEMPSQPSNVQEKEDHSSKGSLGGFWVVLAVLIVLAGAVPVRASKRFQKP